MPADHLGHRIAKLRLTKDPPLSRAQLAREAKMSLSALVRYENGERTNPPIGNVLKLARVLETSIDYLVTGEHPKCAECGKDTA